MGLEYRQRQGGRGEERQRQRQREEVGKGGKDGRGRSERKEAERVSHLTAGKAHLDVARELLSRAQKGY